MSKSAKKKKRRMWVRNGQTDDHHLVPSSRGGETIESNLLKMDIRRHQAWHLLFKNLTLEEIIRLLQKVSHIKQTLKFSKLN